MLLLGTTQATIPFQRRIPVGIVWLPKGLFVPPLFLLLVQISSARVGVLAGGRGIMRGGREADGLADRLASQPLEHSFVVDGIENSAKSTIKTTTKLKLRTSK